jgi:hypothetical protein
MALPTLSKTWQFDINQDINYSTNLGTAQAAMFAIKESFIGFASNPWTVISSSNGTTASAADNWASSADLTWTYAASGAVRSWIVLEQDGISAGFQICIHLFRNSTNSNIQQFIEIVVSPATGFTGGTTTARPTAADEQIVADVSVTGAGGLWGIANAVGHRLHVMQSTDGQCTRVIMTQDTTGTPVAFWLFDRAKNPVTGWTIPWVACVSGSSGTSVTSHPVLNDAATRTRAVGASLMTLFFTCEGYTSAMITENQTVANSLDGSWPMAPIGLYSATASNVGRHGELFDLWYGATTRANGDQYPSTGTLYQFTQFDELILPWDSTNAVALV